MLHNCSQQVRAVGKVISLRHNLWESFLGYLHSSVTFQMRVANLNFNYQPFRQILVPIIKRRKQQKTWKIWISNQSLGNLIFCRVGVLNWPNFSNRFHLSSSMVLRKSSRNAIFFKCHFALCTSDNLVTQTVFKLNKFALLWGEAQLCLPYVCL